MRPLPFVAACAVTVGSTTAFGQSTSRYETVRNGGALLYELSVAAMYGLAPVTTSHGLATQVITADIASNIPFIPIDLHLRLGTMRRADNGMDYFAARLGGAFGVHLGMIFQYAGYHGIADPNVSLLNPTLGVTVDWISDTRGGFALGGAYIANSFYFLCYAGIRLQVDVPFAYPPGVFPTVALGLVFNERFFWDDQAVGCSSWREYLERSS